MTRAIFMGMGWVFVAIGFVGAFVPLLPTTIFLILATACFARSSPRLEAWLVSHPRFGPSLRAWRAEGSISARHKAVAIGAMWVSIGTTALIATRIPPWVRAGLLALAVGVTVYIISRPTRRG
jgi:uncharacterized protein